MNKLRHLTAVSAVVLSLAVAVSPASAQMIVFDPNNYAQNVMTAARELQQINNQVQSLTNQAQMLINQAKNLAQPADIDAEPVAIDDYEDPVAPRPGPENLLQRSAGPNSLFIELWRGADFRVEQRPFRCRADKMAELCFRL